MTIPSIKKLRSEKHGLKGEIRAYFALGVVSIVWGTTWLASRKGVQYMPALQLASIRQGISGILFVLYFVVSGYSWPKGKEWRTVFILSILNFYLTNGLTTWGVQFISGGLGAIIAAIFPLWVVIISGIFSKTFIPKKAFAGIIIGFAGICLVFYDHLVDFINANFRFGILISIAGGLSWALGSLYTKKQAQEFNPYFSLGLQMLISGILLYFSAFATNNIIPLSAVPWQAWTSIAYLVVFSSIVCYVAYVYVLQHLPIEQVSIYAYINPIVAVLAGALIFNEKLTVYLGLGGLVTIYGVYLVNSGALIRLEKKADK